MLDNQTRMRSMLDLIESVDQGKKIKLNESADQTADQTWTVEYTIETKSYGADTENETFGEKTVKAKSAAEAIEKVKSSTKRAYDFKAHPVKNVNEDVEDSGSSSDAEELANDALDAAALSIQDALGIEDGDFAGMFFAGDAGKTILEILTDYAREEIRNQSENDDSDYVDDEESNNSYYDSDREGDSNTRSNQFESGEGNSSSREGDISGFKDGYNKWESKHPDFAKNYNKYKTSNPEGTLKSFIAHMKKGALAEGVRLKKFRQVADILKTLPENNRKILAKRHCKIFENHNPRFNSKKFMTYIGLNESLNESGGNTVQVTFVNSGYGITGNEKPQTVEKLGMDIDQGGRPILYIKSPAYGDKMRADWDAKNNRWIVDQD